MPKFEKGMVLKVDWVDASRDDLNSELEYVFNELGSSVAENAFQKVLKSIEKLRSFPKMGKDYDNIHYHGNVVRSFSMRQISIIYCQQDNCLMIVALWNNRRDDTQLADVIAAR